MGCDASPPLVEVLLPSPKPPPLPYIPADDDVGGAAAVGLEAAATPPVVVRISEGAELLVLRAFPSEATEACQAS